MRKHTVITEEINGVEVELDFEPVPYGQGLLTRVTEDQIIVGYVTDDFGGDSCNPMTENDCNGQLITKPERYGGGSITDDSSWGRYLGLTEDGEPDLEHDVVVERAITKVTPALRADIDFVDWCLEDDLTVEEGLDELYNYPWNAPSWVETIIERELNNAWDELYAEGVLGEKFAVPVSWCSSCHGPGTASAHTTSVNDCNAVWVPDKCCLENLGPNATQADAEKYAQSVLDEYVKWCNGEVYGVVVQTFELDGTQIDTDSCWGFIGQEWAEEALKSDYFPKEEM